MTRTATVRSDRFDAEIEYFQADLSTDDELIAVWGCDDNGTCYFIYFVDGVFDDNLTEEA